jgi:hypothetical protein
MDQNSQNTTTNSPFETLSVFDLAILRKMCVDSGTPSDIEFIKRIDLEFRYRESPERRPKVKP